MPDDIREYRRTLGDQFRAAMDAEEQPPKFRCGYTKDGDAWIGIDDVRGEFDVATGRRIAAMILNCCDAAEEQQAKLKEEEK